MSYKGGTTLKKYYCKDCGKRIHFVTALYGSSRCKSCCRKGSLNACFGLKRPNASERLKENNPMKDIAVKTRVVSSMRDGRRKGKNNFWYGKKRPDIGLRMRGKNNPVFIKPSYGNGGYYKNIWMRSSYEIAYAKWLDGKNIEWQYEPNAFDLGNTTYTPDFYLPEDDTYIEIKGYWREDAKEKFKLFKKIYNNIKVIVLDQKRLKEVGALA